MTRASQLASVVALGGVLSLGAQSAAPELRIEGGSRDDQILARAAFGRPAVLDTTALEQGKAAILASDRFRAVQVGQGPGAWVRLEPWPALRGVEWRGDKPPGPLFKTLAPSLRPGIRVGEKRMEAWRFLAELRLREAGYPEAKVTLLREEEDRRMVVNLNLGSPALIQRVEWTGLTEAYRAEQLLKTAGIQPGRTLWTESLRRKAQAALRKRFQKDHRYEGGADFEWLGAGVLKANLQPGPLLRVVFEGENLPWWGLKEWVPLLKAGRFSQELYEEGDRRLLRHFLDEGFLDVQVSHRFAVLRGTPERPEEARVTYVINLGKKIFAQGLRFEGNQQLSEVDLRKAAKLPSRDYATLWTQPPEASPARLSEVEARIKALYIQRGFPEVRVRRRLERRDNHTSVTMVIRETERRELRDLEVELPKGAAWDPLELGEALVRVIAGQPRPLPGGDARTRHYSGDRFGSKGTLIWLPADPGATMERVQLRLEPPIPFVKSELAPVLTTLRQKVAALGAPRPLDRLVFEPEEDRIRVRITVPPQPLAPIQRLTVFGADHTRARALVREAQLVPGAPLDPKALSSAQVRIGNLRAFQRVELLSLGDATPVVPPGPLPWQPGDLILGLEERSPWAFTGGFGYDKSQGYHFTGGVQRLNLLGEGEALDLGVRVGDATLDSKSLRNAFPTGIQNRSLDSVGLTFTDPALGLNLGKIAAWLPERVQYRSEWTYIHELQSAFQIHRRRVLNDFEWRLNSQWVIRTGHRFERVGVSTEAQDPTGKPFDSAEFFNTGARSPRRAVISAPFFQFQHDTRDSAFDPTRGSYFFAKLELSNQIFGTSPNSSFVKLDLRHQWLWPVGRDGNAGVFAVGVRVGVARPTDHSANELPLSERFFAGGPFTHRGVEPDSLGPRWSVPLIDPTTHKQIVKDSSPQYTLVPLGGQALALVNLEYRFPLAGQFAGEVFIDSGQVYRYLERPSEAYILGDDSPNPPFLTAIGVGLLLKVGIPIKVEYAQDVRRILGKARSRKSQETQLKGVLISAGFQF